MSEILTPEITTEVDAGQAGVESQPEQQQEPTDANGEGSEPEAPATQKPETRSQTHEENDRFKSMRQKAESEAELKHAPDRTIAEQTRELAKLYGISIEELLENSKKTAMERQAAAHDMTYEEYVERENQKRETEATKQKLGELESKVNTYERKDALVRVAETYAATNPKWAQFFNDNRAAIMEVANNIKGDNMTPEAHLDFARMYVFNEKYEPPNMEALKQQHIKEYHETLRNQPPAEQRGGGIPNSPPKTTGNVFKDAEAMLRQMLEGEIK